MHRSKDFLHDFGFCLAEMRRTFRDNRIQGSYPNRVVRRDRQMMFAVLHGRQSNVTARLTNDHVTITRYRSDDILPRQIPWRFHNAITSSKIRCKRIRLGISAGESK